MSANLQTQGIKNCSNGIPLAHNNLPWEEPISIEDLDVQALFVCILKMGGPVGGPGLPGLSSTKCRPGRPGPQLDPPILRMRTRMSLGPGPPGAEWK